MKYKLKRSVPCGHRLHLIMGNMDEIRDKLFVDLNIGLEHEEYVMSIMRKSDAISMELGGELYFVCDEKSITRSIIVHECYHLLGLMFENVGHTPNINHDELEAYSLQRFYDKIEKFVYED